MLCMRKVSRREIRKKIRNDHEEAPKPSISSFLSPFATFSHHFLEDSDSLRIILTCVRSEPVTRLAGRDL